ncbi:MAG: hypothetical protein H0Z24_05570 [Thermosipho sp. (in: Bacteria)]|nr:hypothetical protein [Thermosipho sp. (in: thermotogales)]
MENIKDVLIILKSVILIIVLVYMIWHGWRIDFKSGNIEFSFEIYSLKRFFIK